MAETRHSLPYEREPLLDAQHPGLFHLFPNDRAEKLISWVMEPAIRYRGQLLTAGLNGLAGTRVISVESENQARFPHEESSLYS